MFAAISKKVIYRFSKIIKNRKSRRLLKSENNQSKYIKRYNDKMKLTTF